MRSALIWTTTLVVLLLVGSLGVIVPESVNVPSQERVSAQSTERAPISIDGNEDFTPANGVTGGSGTVEDPYIVEGWTIIASSHTDGITITGTTAYFVVRNIYLDGNYFNPAHGVILSGVTHGTVDSVDVSRFQYGVTFYSSSFCSAVRNNIHDNYMHGLWLGSSTNCVVTGNTFTSNGIFIWAGGSTEPQYFGSHTITTDNTVNGKPVYFYAQTDSLEVSSKEVGQLLVVNCSNVRIADVQISSTDVGIGLMLVDTVTIQNTKVSHIGQYGIYSFSSQHLSVVSNEVSDCSGYGVFFFACTDAEIMENEITGNGAGIGFVSSSGATVYHNNLIGNLYYGWQAYDDQGNVNLWDDGYPSGGNYWSDYGGTDANSDGIGDTPYVIDSDSQDNYPLMIPFGPQTEKVLLVPTYYDSQSSEYAAGLADSFMTDEASQVAEYFETQSFGTVTVEFVVNSPISMGSIADYPDGEADGDWYSPPSKYAEYVLSKVSVPSDVEAILALQDSGQAFRAVAYPPLNPRVACIDRTTDANTVCHELGHALFKFGDYYNEGRSVSFTSSGEIYWWGLMGRGNLIDPSAPVFSKNKFEAGWIGADIGFVGPLGQLKYQLKDFNSLTRLDRVGLVVPLSSLTTYYYLEARNEYPVGYPFGNAYWSTGRPGAVIYKYSPIFNTNPFGFTLAILPGDADKNPNGLPRNCYPTLSASTPTWFDAWTGLRFSYIEDVTANGVYDPGVTVEFDITGYLNLIGVAQRTVDLSGASSLFDSTGSSTSLDLHAYTNAGGHVGMNYSTGLYENTMPGAVSSGDQASEEYILVPKGTEVWFETVVNGTEGQTVEYVSSVVESGPNPHVEDVNGLPTFVDWSVYDSVVRQASANTTVEDMDGDGIPFYQEVAEGTNPNNGTVLSPSLHVSIDNDSLRLPLAGEADIGVTVFAGDVPIDSAQIEVQASLGSVVGVQSAGNGTYLVTIELPELSEPGILQLNVSASNTGFIDGQDGTALPVASRPVALFLCGYEFGDLSTVFEFNASASWDYEDSSDVLEVRWDFDGDGIWDTNWNTEKVAYHQYSVSGTYTVYLEVRDTDGLTNVTSAQIEVVEAIPEFSTVVVPVLSLLFLMVLVARSRLRRDKPKKPG